MSVSKKPRGIHLVSVEREIGGEAAAECAQPFQQLVAAGLARHAELSPVSDVDFDLVVSPSASTTTAGRRTARLFPHFATCMPKFFIDIQFQ
jgi:hypothetical protein